MRDLRYKCLCMGFVDGSICNGPVWCLPSAFAVIEAMRADEVADLSDFLTSMHGACIQIIYQNVYQASRKSATIPLYPLHRID